MLNKNILQNFLNYDKIFLVLEMYLRHLGVILVVSVAPNFLQKMQLEIVAKVSGKAYNRGENMEQKEKLIKKLMSKPKDFTFAEAETLLNYFDYVRSNKGKTSGLRVIFIKEGCHAILLHKPHPRKELLAYQIKTLISLLEQEGLL